MYIKLYTFTRKAIIWRHWKSCEPSAICQTLWKTAKYSFYSFLYLTLTFDLFTSRQIRVALICHYNDNIFSIDTLKSVQHRLRYCEIHAFVDFVRIPLYLILNMSLTLVITLNQGHIIKKSYFNSFRVKFEYNHTKVINMSHTIHGSYAQFTKKLQYNEGDNNDLVRNQSSIFVMKALFDPRKCLQCIQSTFQGTLDTPLVYTTVREWWTVSALLCWCHSDQKLLHSEGLLYWTSLTWTYPVKDWIGKPILSECFRNTCLMDAKCLSKYSGVLSIWYRYSWWQGNLVKF